jgi:hypothetical protein
LRQRNTVADPGRRDRGAGPGQKESETKPRPSGLRSVKRPEQLEFVDIYVEQSRRWQAEPASAAQRRELSHAQIDVAARHYEGQPLPPTIGGVGKHPGRDLREQDARRTRANALRDRVGLSGAEAAEQFSEDLAGPCTGDRHIVSAPNRRRCFVEATQQDWPEQVEGMTAHKPRVDEPLK